MAAQYSLDIPDTLPAPNESQEGPQGKRKEEIGVRASHRKLSTFADMTMLSSDLGWLPEVATWRDADGKGERFGYNALSQSTSAKYNADQVWTGNPVNASRNVTYNGDALNRQNVAADTGFWEGYAMTNGMNQYTNVGGAPVGYDGNFNVTNFNGGLSFNYDAESHLVSGSMSCTYDGLGRCVRRTVGGVTKLFTYDDWKPFLEWDGAGNWMAWNIYGAGPDEILARYDVAGRVSIYKQDQHGNVPAVLDQFGNVVEKYTYDAFGKPTVFDAYGNVLNDANGNPHSAIGNRFLFQGREWIPELGIYDYRHRMYHPGLGHFLQADPTGFDAGDMNLFRYCDDDPVDGTDPTGLLNMWGNLMNFYSGNPSTNVVQDAWNQQRSPGLTMAPIADTRNAQAQSSSMRFVPQPGMTEDYRYHIYAKYRLTSDGKAVAGYDYSVKEKTKVIVNKFTGAKELVIVTGDKLGYQALPRSGIFTDRVGPRTQPSHNVSGELILEQRFLLQYKGHDGPQVSTVLQHVTKVTNGNVHNWVNVLTP